MPPAPESVVFIDMDHTLLENPFIPAVFPQILGDIGRQCGLSYAELLELARSENARRQVDPHVPAALSMDWDDIFTGLAARLGVKLAANALEVLHAHAGEPYSRLLPGARQALEALSAARPRRALALATKGLRKYQLPVLEALGILHFFDDVLAPDVSGVLKNSVKFYGDWPQRTRLQIMVGDTFHEDIAPAHSFGFKTVWRLHPGQEATPEGDDPFARPFLPGGAPEGQPVRPDAVILALSELPAVIERLEHETRTA